MWSLDDRKPISQEASYSDFNYDSGYDFPKELVPTYDQVQAQYPDKTVLIWAVDAFELGEAVRIREVNEYLTEQGYDFVMCTEPIYITGASGGNYPDRLVEGIQKELNAGKPVDIARSRIYSEFVSAKLFEPLDEYLENKDLGRKLHELMPEKYWECLRANGKIYGVCGSLNFMLNNDSGYFVNAELAEKYSFNVNKSILEQLDILQKIKREEKNCSVFVSDLLFYPAYYVSVKAIGDAVYWDGETHSAKCILDNAEYVEKLRFFDTLNREGLMWYNKT